MDEGFLKFYRQGILLDVDLDCTATGEILVSHGVLKLGSRLELPLESKVLHISPTAESEATSGFDRVAFAVRSATPYAIQATKEEEEPDLWKWAD